jgi:hypothetical protein
MEPVSVTARFDLEGGIHPLKFTRSNQTYQVESVGRSWQEEGDRHILVMVPGDRVFELVFSPASMTWFLKQISTGRSAV